ncbi:uncharacterized protein LOC126893530 isoform X2 [Daktulosphaira vitifoliae]|uniref:uncharacterized protein LOC126893530 isoform X1 n=1 Tax=Daktulosphaira vitifoliae TaxID=58002 RepID=UPI0021AA70CC|nr:uncharacterized protein LOC126893530 isoform X1 [Daktulosphaira vitifoliae]XP_050519794.1 uncharacterized protein LOC126893530 isoform X2 [Daktulosphaira vitifoliae]
MAPKLTVASKRRPVQSHSNIYIKKMNHYMLVNSRLRKRIIQYSNLNKQLSGTRNSLLLQNMALEKELNSVRNSNVTLTALYQMVCKKLHELEQNLKNCLPAIVTLSQYFPSMMQTVHELVKIENQPINGNTKESQTKTVRPIMRGNTINNPIASNNKLSMSPIIESPNSEQTPKRLKRSISFRNSPQHKLSIEPYVRLKDVAQLLKNSKSVDNERKPKQSIIPNDGSIWLNNQESPNLFENSKCSENCDNSTPKVNNSFDDKFTVTASVSNTSSNFCHSILISENENSHDNEQLSESCILRNITYRKRQNRRSSETSNNSSVNDSITIHRTRRSATSKVNYKEPSLGKKLRRN